MVSKDELLGMLDKAIDQEENIIVGWGYAINEWIPRSDLTDEQKNQLRDIVDTQTTQSLNHKEIIKNWFKKVSEGSRNEW